MSLATRVANLESKQKRVLRCPWCLFALRETPPDIVKRYNAAPDSVLPTKCWSCGTNYLVPIDGLNDHQREIAALIYNSHPTRQFVDERVHAAHIWFGLYRSEVEQYEEEVQGKATATLSNDRSYASGTLRERVVRQRQELQQRAWTFTQYQFNRFKRLANGPKSFPLDKIIEEIEKALPTSSYDDVIDDLLQRLGFEKYSQSSSHLRSALAVCNRHLRNLKKREASEIVIWGEPLPDTLEEIAFLDQEKQGKIDDALEMKQREEEAKRAERGRTDEDRVSILEKLPSEVESQAVKEEKHKILAHQLLDRARSEMLNPRNSGSCTNSSQPSRSEAQDRQYVKTSNTKRRSPSYRRSP